MFDLSLSKYIWIFLNFGALRSVLSRSLIGQTVLFFIGCHCAPSLLTFQWMQLSTPVIPDGLCGIRCWLLVFWKRCTFYGNVLVPVSVLATWSPLHLRCYTIEVSFTGVSRLYSYFDVFPFLCCCFLVFHGFWWIACVVFHSLRFVMSVTFGWESTR
jgi:hypothetical protein